ERIGKRLRSVAAFDDRRQVENGKSGHGRGSCGREGCRKRPPQPQIQKIEPMPRVQAGAKDALAF
ncbi:hypothetical protein, partial [Mesorhizobium sp.]|uniref:hypothetical protein n=1 Tax=Mesorhizobium sp. TaxID=1871066 RepID=UPI00345B5047